ncbi:hypothetical protein GF366_03885 [Candidatus Peregrinibacteria bacterium]|nr:hypothetical protein [Candidatus Peregrinibacteria bacterium]
MGKYLKSIIYGKNRIQEVVELSDELSKRLNGTERDLLLRDQLGQLLDFARSPEKNFETALNLAGSGEKEASKIYLKEALRLLDEDPDLEERIPKSILKYYSERIEEKFLDPISSDIENCNEPVKVAVVHDIDADGLSSAQLWRAFLQERFENNVEIVTLGKTLTDQDLLEDLQEIPYVLSVDNFVPEREGKRQNVIKAINESSKRGVLILDHHDDEIGDLIPAQVENGDIPEKANVPESIFNDTENFTYVSPRARLGLNSSFPTSRYPAVQLSKVMINELLDEDEFEKFNQENGWLVALGVNGDVFDSKIWWKDLCEELPCTESMEQLCRGLGMAKPEDAEEILEELARAKSPEDVTADPGSFLPSRWRNGRG